MTSIQTAQDRQMRSKATAFDFTELLRTVIKESPKGTEAAHKSTVKRLLKSDDYDVYLDDALDRVIALEYNRAFRSVFPVDKKALKRSAAVRRAAMKKQSADTEIIKRKIISRALDFVLPNGTPLRLATGKECAAAGGWLSRVAERVKPSEIVGKVLSESDVKKLLR